MDRVTGKAVMVKMRSEFTAGGEYDDGGDWEVTDTGKAITIVLIREPWFLSPLTGICAVGEKRVLSPRTHAIERWLDGTISVHPFRNGGLHVFRPIEQDVNQ